MIMGLAIALFILKIIMMAYLSALIINLIIELESFYIFVADFQKNG
jgi:hypothetical protein